MPPPCVCVLGELRVGGAEMRMFPKDVLAKNFLRTTNCLSHYSCIVRVRVRANLLNDYLGLGLFRVRVSPNPK